MAANSKIAKPTTHKHMPFIGNLNPKNNSIFSFSRLLYFAEAEFIIKCKTPFIVILILYSKRRQGEVFTFLLWTFSIHKL